MSKRGSHWCAIKLTEGDIANIERLVVYERKRVWEIARTYGVPRRHVGQCLRGPKKPGCKKKLSPAEQSATVDLVNRKELRITEAARLLKVSKSTIQRLMRQSKSTLQKNAAAEEDGVAFPEPAVANVLISPGSGAE